MLDKQLLKTQIENLYQDILINLDTEKIDHYFAAEYIQETDHDTLNLTEFKLHLQKLKEVVKTLTIEQFKDMLIDEQQQTIFLRYDVRVEKKIVRKAILKSMRYLNLMSLVKSLHVVS